VSGSVNRHIALTFDDFFHDYILNVRQSAGGPQPRERVATRVDKISRTSLKALAAIVARVGQRATGKSHRDPGGAKDNPVIGEPVSMPAQICKEAFNLCTALRSIKIIPRKWKKASQIVPYASNRQHLQYRRVGSLEFRRTDGPVVGVLRPER
jgi:hypothetical protein